MEEIFCALCLGSLIFKDVNFLKINLKINEVSINILVKFKFNKRIKSHDDLHKTCKTKDSRLALPDIKKYRVIR